MEITNICPYCGKEMQCGALATGRDSIRWYPRGEDGRVQNMWSGEGTILLSRAGLIAGQDADAYHCEACGVVIVPVPEIETLGDKVGKWMDKTLGAVGEKLDRAAERREEERAERKREEKRKKDPWEV